MKNFTIKITLLLFMVTYLPFEVHSENNFFSEDDSFARIQLIHNAADLAAANVDVFVNGEIFIPDFAFRTATPFVDVPADVELTIDIAPAGTGIENSVFEFVVEFDADETYVIVANGIVSTTGYDPIEPFTVYPFAPAREVGENANETDLLVFHGSTDAPEVSVWAMGGESALFTFEYGDFAGYLGLPTDDYVIDIRTADGETTVAAYVAPLATLELEGAALTVLASGFFIPENNSDGPAFGLFVATAAGGDLIPLPLYEEPIDEITCAFSQGYWFARPQTVWPYDVEVGGLTFTQEEGAAFWPPNTNTRRAFTQYSAIYLSGVTVSLYPELEDAIETIDNYFANYYPSPAGIQINQAAGFIGDWIDQNHCDDQVIPEPISRVQIIHNAADLAAVSVDVFVNGEIFLPNFAFRTATPFVDVPAGVELTIDIAPAGAGIENSVFDITVEFDANETYIIIANGIVSEEGYDPIEPFTVYPFAPAREVAENVGETDLLVFHGSTDAPEVSVWAMGGESALFAFEYGQFAGYLGLPTDDYVIEIRTADGETIVVAYVAPLATLELEGAALTVVASGFFNPDNNSNGPAFGLYVATAAGGDLIPLPLYEEGEDEDNDYDIVSCAYSQGYWFANRNTVWPYDVELGGMTFTQNDGKAFWPPNTPTRRAFTQYSAIYLSGVTVSEFPELEQAMETIDNYFAYDYPNPAGQDVNRAAGAIGNWIDNNHCDNSKLTLTAKPVKNPVRVFPNPFRDQFSVEFTLEESAFVTIEMYNLSGERIAILFTGQVQAHETHSATMNTTNLPDGIYFYRMIANGNMYMDKLILVR